MKSINQLSAITNGRGKTQVVPAYYWLWGVFVLCWIYLISDSLLLSVDGEGSHAHHPPHHAHSMLVVVISWLVMVYAMMLPMMIGSVRWLCANTPRYHHSCLTLCFIVGYSFVWSLLGVVANTFAPLQVAMSQHLSALPVNALLYFAAGLWCFSDFRRKAIIACGSGMPLRVSGVGMYKDVFSFGLLKSLSCARSCFHIMLVMTIVGHSIGIMAMMTIALFYERDRRPKEVRMVIYCCFILSVSYLTSWVNNQ